MIRLVACIIVFIWVKFLCGLAFSQDNLVANGDFESYSACPQDYVKQGQVFTCNSWISPRQCTPDYFHTCSRLAGIPVNFAGVKNSYSGNGYCGLVMYVKGNPYKEFLQGSMTSALEKGKKYAIAMHVCWAPRSSYQIDQAGIKLIEKDDTSAVLHQFSFPLMNERNWEILRDTFVSTGKEQLIAIGNFQAPDSVVVKNNLQPATYGEKSPIVGAAYYFIDLVEIRKIGSMVPEDLFPVGKYFVGKGIYFDTDQYRLADSSAAYLQRLVQFLKRHPEFRINIEGHTDYYGSKEYNDALSSKRALAVKIFLIQNGIRSQRISTKGWGKEHPIETNQEMQHLNRRIEMKLQ